MEESLDEVAAVQFASQFSEWKSPIPKTHMMIPPALAAKWLYDEMLTDSDGTPDGARTVCMGSKKLQCVIHPEDARNALKNDVHAALYGRR